jgi:hypothetical protein
VDVDAQYVQVFVSYLSANQFVPVQFILEKTWVKNWHICKVLKKPLCLTNLGEI